MLAEKTRVPGAFYYLRNRIIHLGEAAIIVNKILCRGGAYLGHAGLFDLRRGRIAGTNNSTILPRRRSESGIFAIVLEHKNVDSNKRISSSRHPVPSRLHRWKRISRIYSLPRQGIEDLAQKLYTRI